MEEADAGALGGEVDAGEGLAEAEAGGIGCGGEEEGAFGALGGGGGVGGIRAVGEPAGKAALDDVVGAVVGVEGGAVARADVEGELAETAAETALFDEGGAVAEEEVGAVAEGLVVAEAAAGVEVGGADGLAVLLEVEAGGAFCWKTRLGGGGGPAGDSVD